MTKYIDHLTSHQLYLESDSGQIFETRCLEDTNAGMYPTYYIKLENSLKASNSVVNLLKELGDLKVNKNFQPPPYLKQNLLSAFYRKNVFDKINHLRGSSRLKQFLKRRNPSDWYASFDTVDQRIKKLRPFERVTLSDRERTFENNPALTQKQVINEVCRTLESYINKIEHRYPDYEHIIMMGGKDSQLIALTPKITDNWSVFSAYPNHELNKDFVDKNEINVNNLFHHDNCREESFDEFKDKIIASDLYSDPKHLRWMIKIKRITQSFDGKCIFWNGTEADTILSYFEDFHSLNREKYFQKHFNRAASWQSSYHQAFKQLTGCPLISPYHSPEFWNQVMQKYDPNIFRSGEDTRVKIAETLSGGEKVWFPENNPGPSPYYYPELYDTDLLSLYKKELKERID